MHFVQRKQFNETNVTSYAFQQISNLKFFLNASAGHLKRCGGPHVALGPVVGPHWLHQTTLMQSSFNTLRGGYVCRAVEIYIRFGSDFWVSKCKAVFPGASFHNSPAQFFKSLRGVLTLVTCPIVVVNLQVYFSLTERVLRECPTFVFFNRYWCSGRWLFWNYDLFVESARKIDIK